MNNIWTVRNINAHIREFFNFCLGVGYPALSCWESRTIVLFPIDVTKKLEATTRPTLKPLLLSDENTFELEISKCGKFSRRQSNGL